MDASLSIRRNYKMEKQFLIAINCGYRKKKEKEKMYYFWDE
jgi:hypothetical protein